MEIEEATPKEPYGDPEAPLGPRQKRWPAKYIDMLPSSARPLPNMPHVPVKQTKRQRDAAAAAAHADMASAPSPSPPPEEQPLDDEVSITTEPNAFGLYREYTIRPTHDPEQSLGLADACDSLGLASTHVLDPPDPNKVASGLPPRISTELSFGPYKNESVLNLMNWGLTGSNIQSLQQIDKLVSDVILQPSFNKSDLEGFRASREAKALDEWDPDSMNANLPTSAGWKESTVSIHVPCKTIECPEDQAPVFEIPGVFHRDILEVIKEVFESPGFDALHLTPFVQWWKASDDEDPIRVYSEMYTSDAMLQAHAEVLALKLDREGPELERVVVPIPLYSDSTHLAQFGTKELWPAYVQIGNQSKYPRGQPNTFSVHHLAYMPKVSEQSVSPDDIT